MDTVGPFQSGQKITAGDMNRLKASKPSGPGAMQTGYGVFERPLGPRGSGPGLASLVVFEVKSTSGNHAMYNARQQIIDSTNWQGGDRFIDKPGTFNEWVFNIAENNLSSHALQAGDLLVAWQVTDDEGNKRWVGFSPKYAFWMP